MLPDDVLRTAFPLLAVPADGRVPPASSHGTRYLVARDGLYRDLQLPWLRATLRVAGGLLQPTPYGELRPGIELLCGALPRQQLQEFKSLALAALPDETTAVIAWNAATRTWRLVPRRVLQASSARVVYEEAELEDSESLVVDIHSHGLLPAGFSAEDDRDDRGAMKIAAVLGEVHTGAPRLQARLVLPDRFVPTLFTDDGDLRFEVGP